MKRLAIAALAATLLASCAERPSVASTPAATQAPDWPTQTAARLQQIHDALAAGHPGAAPGEDAVFVQWLEQGLIESRTLAGSATSSDSMLAALRYYTTGFRDGHVTIGSRRGSDRPVRWAGWRVALRGEHYLVDQIDTQWPVNLPPLGAELLDCDGHRPAAIVADDLAPFIDRRLELESTRMHLAPWISVDAADASSPVRRLAQRCRFLLPDRRELTLRQTWREPTPSSNTPSRRPTQSLRDLGNGIYWVHASNFQPNADEVRALDALLTQLRELPKPQLIVFDLRGNQGGNGFVGYRILEAALGDYSQRQPPPVSTTTRFRVSQIAIDAMNWRLERFASSDGTDSDMYRYVMTIRDELQQASQHRQTWYPQPSLIGSQTAATPAENKARPPYRGPVALVTDSWCASACLDFVDQVVAMSGAAHLGQPTAADTVYNDVAFIDLGNGNELVLPLKVMRGGARGHNQPLIPQHRFDGDINDTAAVQAWVLGVLLPTGSP